MARLLTTLDVIKEEEKPFWGGAPGPTEVITYQGLDEYEKFSPDQEWMPRTILMAKSTLVWLYQLSKKYEKEITRLDQIPDEELDELADRGFTGLWLIGLWERSNASRTIKQWMGNPEAAASAYSLYDYDIAAELGGWGALAGLRERCFRRGIRLGSDMVPNHTGLDSRWIMEHPERFLQLPYPPFPTYIYNSGNLSNRDGVGIQLEDHYYSRSDAAVVFKRMDFRTGDTRYIYHGNDGTSMPWNDTAQIDFLNPEAREAVIRTIIGVCQQFSIVRFDAAMTLAKRHIQRLWYPEPGHGGDIASRSEHAVSNDEFNRRIPNEFWREVVDRCAAEAPHTLLLAEAFWMMEGYFVRTLGMHRVYNSAFMNMLKKEENAKYRATIKNTLEFDPEILKRFVNFMNNPDEETAAAQFGKGDKYFGICTLLVTMPGLPMFGHGQIEGFEEKYGMEYRRAYRDEQPDSYLVERHKRDIFPLMKRRHIFSGSAGFRLYDFYTSDGHVDENVFAYSNRNWDDRALVLYNNSYYETSGWIKQSSPAIPQESGGFLKDTLTEALSIHGEGCYFTCLREQRSGLWFIRSSKSLSENGLFAVLKGYESQVFMDIHEREDGLPVDSPWACRWSRLNHHLEGRGVASLDAAVEDIFLADLYRPFTALFESRRIDTLREALKNAAAGKTASNPEEALSPDLAEAFRAPVLDFARAAAEYLDGAGGRYEPFVRPESDTATPIKKPAKKTGKDAGSKTAPEASGEDAWAWFSAFLVRFLESSGFKAPAETGPYEPLYALAYGALALLRPVLGPRTDGAEAKALLAHWRLDRKIREAYQALGFNEDEAGRVAEIAQAVLVRTGAARPVQPRKKSSSAGKSPRAAKTSPVPGPAAQAGVAAFLAANYEAEDFRRLVRVNRFDDATWFNKEAFEETLYYAFLFLLAEDSAFVQASSQASGQATSHIFGSAPGPAVSGNAAQRAVFATELIRLIFEAEKKSGYKLDELIALLSGR
jgi:glycosidase